MTNSAQSFVHDPQAIISNEETSFLFILEKYFLRTTCTAICLLFSNLIPYSNVLTPAKGLRIMKVVSEVK